MKKTIIGLMVLVIVLSGCTDSAVQSKPINTNYTAVDQTHPEFNTLEDCDAKAEEYYKKKCYADIAIEAENPGICAQITDLFYRESYCYPGIAVKTQNKGICDSIEDPAFKEDCKAKIAEAN